MQEVGRGQHCLLIIEVVLVIGSRSSYVTTAIISLGGSSAMPPSKCFTSVIVLVIAFIWTFVKLLSTTWSLKYWIRHWPHGRG